jgi:hypothetical protein
MPIDHSIRFPRQSPVGLGRLVGAGLTGPVRCAITGSAVIQKPRPIIETNSSIGGRKRFVHPDCWPRA